MLFKKGKPGKVVVLGGRGMLGAAIESVFGSADIECEGYDLPEVDITQAETLEPLPPAGCVINCAAYTDVDGAEDNSDSAFMVNAEGAGNVARYCEKNSVFMAHISTDYVFDGESQRPYHENDPVNPVNIYGRSKAKGEEAVRRFCRKSLIVRTQSLFGKNGKNFVSAIVSRLDRDNGELRIVSDQWSCPTNTKHLAMAVLNLIRVNAEGTVHASASDSCSWYEFGKTIAEMTGASNRIVPVGSTEYPRKARRPRNSALDTSLYEQLTGQSMPEWRQGLVDYMNEMRQQQTGDDV
ncbi:MAG: dTDP-4-dehydrorhamnose reductase [Verrucomicrobiota bacterium]